MKYPAINNQLFIHNRQQFVKMLKPKSLAIFHSHDEMPKSADSTFAFSQNRDILYLSGIDQEDTILMLFPECPNPLWREILFVKRTNETIAIWEGHKYTKEEATLASGIKKVMWTEEFDGMLRLLMHQADNVYLNLNEHDRATWRQSYKDLDFAHRMQREYPLHNYNRLGPIMHVLRSCKHPVEIELMQRAADITEAAFRRVCKFVKPGVTEYEIEAEISHEFIRSRATGHAYTPIIASGKNACVLHYIENNMPCNDGEIILMDFGAEYANYAADLTRCIPVNGKFTTRQKQIYQAVLHVMKGAKQMLVTGNNWDDYHTAVGKMMTEQLLQIGLITSADCSKDDWQNEPWNENKAYRKYFMHGTSHYLGLDVHDVGSRYQTFRPGNVFTCEPGIYIPEENIGIRLENDILITESGNFDLMRNIPLEIEEIEEAMRA